MHDISNGDSNISNWAASFCSAGQVKVALTFDVCGWKPVIWCRLSHAISPLDSLIRILLLIVLFSYAVAFQTLNEHYHHSNFFSCTSAAGVICFQEYSIVFAVIRLFVLTTPVQVERFEKNSRITDQHRGAKFLVNRKMFF